MNQEELLHHLVHGDMDLRPFYRKVYEEDFPNCIIYDEEAWHYTLCKYKIGTIKDRQGYIINYYIYEQITRADSAESENVQDKSCESESKIPAADPKTGGQQEEGEETQENPAS